MLTPLLSVEVLDHVPHSTAIAPSSCARMGEKGKAYGEIRLIDEKRHKFLHWQPWNCFEMTCCDEIRNTILCLILHSSPNDGLAK